LKKLKIETITKYIKPNNMNLIKKVTITIVIILGLTFSFDSFAQDAPPPPAEHGQDGNQDGRGAPIGGGLFILLGLGAVYGGRKLYQMRKENLEE